MEAILKHETFLERLEADLRARGGASQNVCREFGSLGDTSPVPVSVLTFVGCKDQPGAQQSVTAKVPRPCRLWVARLMWLRLGAHTATPAWSSFVLEQMFANTMMVPGGEIGDAIVALHEILREHTEALGETTANLIRETVVGTFTQHRTSYDASDFSGLTGELADPASRPLQTHGAGLAIIPAVLRRPTGWMFGSECPS